MKIVILDALTLGDADLSVFEQFGDLKIYKYTTPEQTTQRIKNAEIIITNKVVIGEKELQNAPKLKLICVTATGYNNIDTQATTKHKVIVANVKGYSTESVAQYVFANILAVANSVFQYAELTKSGKWTQAQVFTRLDYPIFELKNKKLGIIGYGNIGKRVAQLGKAFGMQILIAQRPNTKYNDKITRLPMEQVLKQADIITLHTPLTNQTKNLITIKELSLMKPSAIIVNAARGGIINEKDLFLALKNNIIKHAIIDVLTIEPPTEGNILFSAPNITITPHIAWTSNEARKKLIDGIVQNIQMFLEGKTKQIAVI